MDDQHSCLEGVMSGREWGMVARKVKNPNHVNRMTARTREGGEVLIQKECQRFIVLQTPGLFTHPCTFPLSACASNAFSRRLGGGRCTFDSLLHGGCNMKHEWRVAETKEQAGGSLAVKATTGTGC